MNIDPPASGQPEAPTAQPTDTEIVRETARWLADATAYHLALVRGFSHVAEQLKALPVAAQLADDIPWRLYMQPVLDEAAWLSKGVPAPPPEWMCGRLDVLMQEARARLAAELETASVKQGAAAR